MEEGILPGGGVALLNAVDFLEPFLKDRDEGVGVGIVKRAVEEPIRCIAANAGAEGSVILNAIKNSPPGVGFDASKGDFPNMIERGIIDPAKVVRTALENAASVAVMILTTESLVTDIPEKEQAPMPAMPEY